MTNSFYDLVNESQMNEMGIRGVERLSGSELGQRRQESEERRRRQGNAPRPRTYNEAAGELVTALKRIPRTDITMEVPPASRYYYPRFPENIVALMTEVFAIDNSRAINEFGRWRDVFPSNGGAIHFEIEAPSSFQRSHFPGGGIPPMLRGTGMGYKLYRALLSSAGYLSSNTAGTREKDMAWGSLLSYKANPDGTPSIDDAHGVIGPTNWMAIDKETLSQDQKIEVVTRFISDRIGIGSTRPNQFDMDDELIELMPDVFLSKLSDLYLRSLVETDRITQDRYNEIVSSRSEAERLERERRERAEAEQRERQARAEAQQRRDAQARIQQYGVDMDADWEVGDFIVVKQYLLQTDYSGLPIRRVVYGDENEYGAVLLRDAKRLEAGTITLGSINDFRRTRDKSNWVKVIPDRIPDLTRVNLNQEEQEYIVSHFSAQARTEREESQRRAEAERIEADRIANKSRAATQPATVGATRADLRTFGLINPTQSELAELLSTRPSLEKIDILKKSRTPGFLKYIFLAEPQLSAFRSWYGIPVFAAFKKRSPRYVNATTIKPLENLNDMITRPDEILLINLVTGSKIDPPYVGLGLKAYELFDVTEADKLGNRNGDIYYIQGHQNHYGMLAKSERTTRNTINQPFIYMHVLGHAHRPISVRLDLLKKIGTPIPIE